MIPAPFAYVRADSLAKAISLLNDNQTAMILAGGHALLPVLKLRRLRPDLLIDIGGLPGLSHIRIDGDEIAIGALVRHTDVQHSPVLRAHCPLLSQTAGQIADAQVRNRGTIGGSAALGNPASDLPTALLALDATFLVEGPHGHRRVSASTFLDGGLRTGEILTEIRVPKLDSRTRTCYLKFSRRALDWATVGVALVVSVTGDRVEDIRIALATMGPTQIRASAAEARLLGSAPRVEEFAHCANAADYDTEPRADHNASAEFRRYLARTLVLRALGSTRL